MASTSMRFLYSTFAACPVALIVVATAGAQAREVTRAAAIDAALARGARLALAAADTGVARGLLLAARELPNPAFDVSYTQSTPRYHLVLGVPVDYPWVRSTRIRAATTERTGALYRFRMERAASALDADTLYTRALAAREHVRLSRRTALDADSLRRIVVARRDAGDASTLDVELATLNAGAQANIAADDSLAYVSELLLLQAVMGVQADSVRIALSDTLAVPSPDAIAPYHGVTLPVASAQAVLDAAELYASLQRRNRWAPPGITVGYDTYDPGGTGNKLLPAIGLSLPLPLLNRNGGAVALADAERDRARAALALARVESDGGVARALRDREVALARVARGQVMVASAERVATMSVAAYREGAAPLASVLEAQRAAREMLAAYVDDLSRAWIAVATARVLTLTATPERPQ
ncbi:MAG: TolC family protein [Gemmatimonadaceae bacterium]|nr:TolC family protein [Gemmatimonadaceae bacterium]